MDITKCKGTNCTLKNDCYRFIVHSTSYTQSFFTDIPYKDGKCDMFWKMNDKLPMTEKEEYKQFMDNMNKMFPKLINNKQNNE